MTDDSRRRARRFYKRLYQRVSEIMCRRDPVGIFFGNNPDEYGLEVSAILTGLEADSSVDRIATLLHEVALAWFGECTAGPRSVYVAAATDIHELLQEPDIRHFLATWRAQPRGATSA